MNLTKPIKVDFLINKMSGGGAERVVSILANHLNKTGYVIRIITFQGDDKFYLHPAIKRIRLHNQPFFQSVRIHSFISLLRFYSSKENRPDIISSHISLLGYSTIPIAKFYKIKIVVSEHFNHKINTTSSQRFLWSYIYQFADAVTVLTSFDLAYFKKKNRNVWLMHNPCSFEIVQEKNRTNKRDKIIIAVGDLNRFKHKGFDNLLHIAKKVLEKHPNWKFNIIGGGDYGLQILTSLCSELGLSDKLIFSGYRTDVKEILARSEIFILPSRYEGLPMVLLEAMSQGTSCISYDCISGPSEIITNGVNGLLIENQNIDEMILGITKLIESPEIGAKFREEAPKAIKKFSVENIGKKWEELFQSLV